MFSFISKGLHVLKLAFFDKNITLDKSAGNSYIFPVSIKHEVTKITKGNRYSLIWFLKNTNIKFNSNFKIQNSKRKKYKMRELSVFKVLCLALPGFCHCFQNIISINQIQAKSKID